MEEGNENEAPSNAAGAPFHEEVAHKVQGAYRGPEVDRTTNEEADIGAGPNGEAVAGMAVHSRRVRHLHSKALAAPVENRNRDPGHPHYQRTHAPLNLAGDFHFAIPDMIQVESEEGHFRREVVPADLHAAAVEEDTVHPHCLLTWCDEETDPDLLRMPNSLLRPCDPQGKSGDGALMAACPRASTLESPQGLGEDGDGLVT